MIALALTVAALLVTQAPPALDDVARQLLHDADASGFIYVTDVRSGQVLVDVNVGTDSRVRPLSVVKVFVAASWIDHGLGDLVVDCVASGGHLPRRMRVEEVISSGCDSAGAAMAVALREKIGGAAVLRDLRRYGLEDLTLKADASDSDWGSTLTLGEDQMTVTPQQVAGFLRAIGQDGLSQSSPGQSSLGQNGVSLFSKPTARRLIAALDGTVDHGTASGIKDALARTGWHLGGKTGTGPGQCGDTCDGWFASLLSDPHGARYAILVFIKGKGLGGGLAARTAASMAERLARR
jgi:membrane peptidoglycan carboxypeptidase